MKTEGWVFTAERACCEQQSSTTGLEMKYTDSKVVPASHRLLLSHISNMLVPPQMLFIKQNPHQKGRKIAAA